MCDSSNAVDEMLPVNLDRMLARWKLGRALRKVERRQGERTDTSGHDVAKSFKAFVAELQLDIKAAERAQRIGCLPPPERDAAFEEARAAA